MSTLHDASKLPFWVQQELEGLLQACCLQLDGCTLSSLPQLHQRNGNLQEFFQVKIHDSVWHGFFFGTNAVLIMGSSSCITFLEIPEARFRQSCMERMYPLHAKPGKSSKNLPVSIVNDAPYMLQFNYDREPVASLDFSNDSEGDFGDAHPHDSVREYYARECFFAIQEAKTELTPRMKWAELAEEKKLLHQALTQVALPAPAMRL